MNYVEAMNTGILDEMNQKLSLVNNNVDYQVNNLNNKAIKDV